MLVIEGRFDGKVFIPDEAVDLPLNQRGIWRFEPLPESASQRPSLPPGTPAADLLKFVGMISDEDLKLMQDAIEEGCEQIDLDGW